MAATVRDKYGGAALSVESESSDSEEEDDGAEVRGGGYEGWRVRGGRCEGWRGRVEGEGGRV